MIMWNHITEDSKPSSLYLTTNTSTTIQLTIPDDLDSNNEIPNGQFINFNSEMKIALPPKLQSNFLQKERKAVRIKSTEPISVVLFDNNDHISDDSSMIMPRSKLSTTYMVVTPRTFGRLQNVIGVFGIAALDEDTRINITLRLHPKTTGSRININGKSYGHLDSFEISMNNFETFQVGSYTLDFTGTIIESSKPVAVFSGSRCNMSLDSEMCSQNMEQLPPTNEWDQKYIMTPDFDETMYYYRIISVEDTWIDIHYHAWNFTGRVLVTGGYTRRVEVNTNEVYLTGSKPFLVARFMAGNTTNSDFRKTYMTIVQGVNQYKRLYKFVVPEQYVENFVTITIQASFIQDIRINGQTVDPQMIRYQKYANFEYTNLIVEVLPGPIEVTTTSSVPFGLAMNGYSSLDAYGFEGSAIFP